MEIIKPKTKTISHILIFPLPIQGPVNSMLKLSELLLFFSNNIHITFLTTHVVYRNLSISARAHERFTKNPRFRFHVFSDGLSEDHIRGGAKFLEMFLTVKKVSKKLVQEMVMCSKFSCVIVDGLFNFVLDVGNDANVPVFYFDTISPSCLWVYFWVPKLVEDVGEIPFKGHKDLDALVNVPGMDEFLRRRDLPDFCHGRDETDKTLIQIVTTQMKQFERAKGIILNTFDDFDSLALSYMRSHCPNKIYTIGPLHMCLKENLQTNSNLHHSNSFWQEDRNCLSWLDKQPSRSVIYCSFGSQITITKEELMEFWYGLANSGIRFIWVNRPRSIIGMDEDFDIDQNFLEITKKRGCIVSWAPQVEVLSHSAIGGFLTHSGWNSTMESVSAGVPMICWPRYVDQLVNSRLVSQIWKIGVDMKDSCNRVTIEKMVKEVMVYRKQEFLENATKFSILAKNAILEGGSSYESLHNLINDISLSNLQTKAKM